MGWGTWFVRSVTLAAGGLGISWLLIFYPNALQAAANGLLGFEPNASYRLYSLVAIIIGSLYFVSWLAARNIRGDALTDLE